MAWVLALIPLWGFWHIRFFDVDEGLYATAVREMTERGDWLLPTFDGRPFFEKPILMFWSAQAFFRIGLPGELAFRLLSVLAYAGLIGATISFARRRFDDLTALFSVLILASCPLLIGVSRLFMPDTAFVCALSVSLFGLWSAVSDPPGLSRWLIGPALGVAVLAKGPAALVIFAIVALYVVFRLRTERSVGAAVWLAAIAGFAVTVALWYWPIYVQQGSAFLRGFLYEQNLGRFFGEDQAHLGPGIYYIPVVLLTLAPFSLALLQAWRTTRTDAVGKFLWCWAIAAFVLFSAAGTKLPHYILPAVPPLAILLARTLATRPPLQRFVPTIFAALVAAACFIAAGMGKGPTVVLMPLGIGAVFGLVASVFFALRTPILFLESAASVYPIVLTAALLSMPAYHREAYKDLNEVSKSLLREPNLPVVEYRMSGLGARGATGYPSLRYYLPDRMSSADWPDELAARIDRESLVLSRRGRFDPDGRKALEALGMRVYELKSSGEFAVYRVLPSK